MATNNTSQPITGSPFSLDPDGQAIVLIEMFGGDRLRAWQHAYRNSHNDLPGHAEFWLKVADAIVQQQTVSTPIRVAMLLVDLLQRSQCGYHSLTHEPCLQEWVTAVRRIFGTAHDVPEART